MNSKTPYTWEMIKKIRQKPHLLGLLAGKDKLTQMHSDWMHYLLDAKEDRTLMAHRASFKSTAITEIGVIYYFMFHPNARVAIVRKSYTAAAEEVRNISNIMMSSEICGLLEFVWGEKWRFTIKREGKLELSVKKTKTKEVSLTALGIESSMIGGHFDFIILDDVVDVVDRISEAAREKTKLIIQDIRANIIERGHPVVAVGTIWHKKDAYSILPPALKYPISVTGLISPEEAALIQTKTTPILYAINYKLEFEADQDMLFLDPYIGKWHADEVSGIRAHVDAAYDGDHFCALTIMGRKKDGKINAVGWVYPGNIKEWFGVIANKLVQYRCNKLCMEENADRGFSADFLKLIPAVKENHIWIDTYRELTNKHIKVSTYAAEIWKDIEFAEETDTEYLEQCIDYREKMEPDDAIDSLASLAREGNFSATKNWHSNIWSW